MDPKEIEASIKGLLGLNLGVGGLTEAPAETNAPQGPVLVDQARNGGLGPIGPGPVGSRLRDPIGPPVRMPPTRPPFSRDGLQLGGNLGPVGASLDQIEHSGKLNSFGMGGLGHMAPFGPLGSPYPTFGLGPNGPVGVLGQQQPLVQEFGPITGQPIPRGAPGQPVPPGPRGPRGPPGFAAPVQPIGPVGPPAGLLEPPPGLPRPALPPGLNILTIDDDVEQEASNSNEVEEEQRAPSHEEMTDDEMIFLVEMEEEVNTDNTEEFKPSTAVKEYLAEKYLYPLARKSTKFPRAKWFCRLCEYHCDNLAKCKEHFSDTRHSRLTRTKEIETTLYHLPRPTKHHLDCLDSLLAQIEKEHGLGLHEVQERKAVALGVHNLLQNHIPGCSVRLYGSSLSGFGLKDSNVNLDLQITADQKPHLALLKALEVLHDSPHYLNVVDEFTAKIPIIKFVTADSDFVCELSLSNHNAYQTSALLADYWSLDPRVRTVGVAFRYWASLTHLDRQAEGTLPSHTFAILLVYYAMQQTKPVLPCIHDWLDDRNEDTYVRDAERLAGWRTQNKMSPAELWIELFAFLAVGFNSQEHVVSLRKSGTTTNEEKQWKTRRLAVEDPFSAKRNLCRSIQAVSVYDYISDCLKTGYLYFGTLQTSLGSIISRITVREGVEEREEDISLSDWTLESWLAKKGTILTEKEAVTANSLVPRNMLNFQFDSQLLTNGAVPAVQCMVCGQEGHLPSQCPEEQLPPLVQLPQLTSQHLRLLDNLCESVTRDWEPQELELRDRDYIMSDLSRYIKKFWPKAELTLFGSSANGFVFRGSDLDISLTFRGVVSSEGMDCVKIIEELAEKVKRMVGMRNVVAITSAKVPIIKLYHQQCQMEADISLYNVLGRENTRLLNLYVDLDPRVRILGYMVKLFAKVCDIGDASRGSLSSYAYILMMLFYLQKCSPPVIPVLQEMYPTGTEKPEVMVDGWNAWFFSDRRRVVNEWPGYGRNRMSVGELWLGFLDFYAGQWDDKRLVVCTRQLRPLTKFEKMWNSPCIAIEDPFELAHNLGAGISRKMNLYIKKAFINGRKLYGTPLMREPPGYRTVQDYYFDPELLTDGAPPNDRGCRACGKIGHLVADCPRKKAADQRKKQQKQERLRSNSEHQQETEANRGAGNEGRNRTKSEIPGSTAPGGRPQGENQATGVGQQRQEERNKEELHVREIEVLDPSLKQQIQQLPISNVQKQLFPVSNVHQLPNRQQQQQFPLPNVQQQMLLQDLHRRQVEGKGDDERVPVQSLSRTPSGSNGFDLGAFAAMVPGQGHLFPSKQPVGVGLPDAAATPTIVQGAFNAEDLEASFITESREEREKSHPTSGPPPGFGGPPLLQDILGQLATHSPGPQRPPPGPLPDFLQQHLLQQHHLHQQLEHQNQLEHQMRMSAAMRTGPVEPDIEQNGLDGGYPGGDIRSQHVRDPLLGGDMRSQHVRDPLGIQSLAHQAGGLQPPTGPFGPMMLPMIPLGLPPHLGMLPFSGAPPGPNPPHMNPLGGLLYGQHPAGRAPTLPPAPKLPPSSSALDSPVTGSPQPPPADPSPPLLLGGWPTTNSMFGPIAGRPTNPMPPFSQTRDTGFPSSVLFPGDLQHPLSSDPLPIPPLSNPTTDQASPEVQMADGSPMTPPNLNLDTFNFED